MRRRRATDAAALAAASPHPHRACQAACRQFLTPPPPQMGRCRALYTSPGKRHRARQGVAGSQPLLAAAKCSSAVGGRSRPAAPFPARAYWRIMLQDYIAGVGAMWSIAMQPARPAAASSKEPPPQRAPPQLRALCRPSVEKLLVDPLLAARLAPVPLLFLLQRGGGGVAAVWEGPCSTAARPMLRASQSLPRCLPQQGLTLPTCGSSSSQSSLSCSSVPSHSSNRACASSLHSTACAAGRRAVKRCDHQGGGTGRMLQPPSCPHATAHARLCGSEPSAQAKGPVSLLTGEKYCGGAGQCGVGEGQVGRQQATQQDAQRVACAASHARRGPAHLPANVVRQALLAEEGPPHRHAVARARPEPRRHHHACRQ